MTQDTLSLLSAVRSVLILTPSVISDLLLVVGVAVLAVGVVVLAIVFGVLDDVVVLGGSSSLQEILLKVFLNNIKTLQG